jgi:hypothetical protein
MTAIVAHRSIEQRLADLRRGALMRMRVTMRVARATPVSLSASNTNNNAPLRTRERGVEGAREGSSAVDTRTITNRSDHWKLRTSPTSRY